MGGNHNAETDAGLRNLRNFLILGSFFGGVFFITACICLYGVTTIMNFQDGGVTIRDILQYPVRDQLSQLYENFLYYWSFAITNIEIFKEDITYSNYYLPRLLSFTVMPPIVTLMILWIFRAPIADWQPFKPAEAQHGSAHWATPKEMAKIGKIKYFKKDGGLTTFLKGIGIIPLFKLAITIVFPLKMIISVFKNDKLYGTEGLLMGHYKGPRYYIINDYQHILLFAPTGSGKGVGFVIPNLLFWKESVLVHDIKLENYELTSGYRYRKLKQTVYVWEPANPEGMSHCYNPLDWIDTNMGRMVDDVQKITSILIQKQEFWENEARALITGLILYLVCDDSKQQSFGEVVRTMRSKDVAYDLAVAMDTMGTKMHPVAYMNIAAFLQKADKERSGVISTGNSKLDLWSNPIIDKTTARSDFDLREFKKKLATVYVGLTPDNIDRLKPLMAMFYQQASAFMSRKMPGKDEPYGVLYLMDEFPTLGKLDQFLQGIAYFRGYHVKLFLIVQDTQQLKGAYEDSGMNSFLSNSTYRVTFSANNVETAKLISELVGNKTIFTESMNRPKFFDLNPASRSLHVSKQQRALLLPQEVISMDRDDQIILIEASPPIRCKKIKYYSDPFFKKRLLKMINRPKQDMSDLGKNKNADAGSGTGNTTSSTTENDFNDDVKTGTGGFSGSGTSALPQG